MTSSDSQHTVQTQQKHAYLRVLVDPQISSRSFVSRNRAIASPTDGLQRTRRARLEGLHIWKLQTQKTRREKLVVVKDAVVELIERAADSSPQMSTAKANRIATCQISRASLGASIILCSTTSHNSDCANGVAFTRRIHVS